MKLELQKKISINNKNNMNANIGIKTVQISIENYKNAALK